ncbi:MAG: type II secretion system protein GspN, partial [Deltaproteobacteria bacterium 13_1_40CM_3_71_4]
MRRTILGGAPIAAGLVALFLFLLFPIDTVVRALLARATPAGWPAIVFQRAALRPTGLLLEDVTLHGRDGAALVAAERVFLRPSLRGLWRDGTGLPWHVEALVCGGTGVATVTGDGAPAALSFTWQDVDLGGCPPLALAAGALAGRATMTARVRLGPPAGEGTVEVHAGEWRSSAGPLVAVGTLHAERASFGWRLVGDRVALTSFELHGPDVSAEGEGTVRLAAPLEASGLELRLAVAAAP